MKQMWYTDPISISNALVLQCDPGQKAILFYSGEKRIQEFSLNRKIYTFFKSIQQIVQSPNYLTIEKGLGDVYSGEIRLKRGVSMQVTNVHGPLTVDFYHHTDQNKELLYLMPLTYTTNTLFQNMLIPYHLLDDPTYRVRHIFKFLDMMVILNQFQDQEGNAYDG